MQKLYTPNAHSLGSLTSQGVYQLPGGAPIVYPPPPTGPFGEMKFNVAANSGLLALLEGYLMATMNVLDAAGSTVAVEKPLVPGSAADAASRPVAWSTEGKAQIGALTETAPASDTASSGLNGRLQRVAQRLTSLITALGSPFQAGGSIGNTSFGSTVADGANVTLGAKTDAKNAASDATSISAMSVFKQISFSIQAAAASLATLVSGAITPGTAGTPTSAVLSVQGVASMTPISTSSTLSATASGTTSSRVNAAASTNATSLKASAGNLRHIDVYNPAAYTVFLKLYNKASAPTVGTDTPVMTIPVQAGGGYSKHWPSDFSFPTGIAYAITKLQADSDTTVVVAGDLTGNIIWI